MITVSVPNCRLLPDKDLVNAASVNRRWFKLCRYDRVISERIYSHMKLRKKSKMKSLLRSVRHSLRRSEQGKPFAVFNCLQLSKPQRVGKYTKELYGIQMFVQQISNCLFLSFFSRYV